MDRLMNRKMLTAVMAALSVARLAAVTVGPEWCVAYPQEGSKEVKSVLRVAAEEVADDINEATGTRKRLCSGLRTPNHVRCSILTQWGN